MSEPISINVKASNDQKYVISIKVTETVLDFKQKIAENCDTPADRMRLIYSGRVLKDADTLETYKIAEGHTVHMVRGAAPASSSAAAASSATSTPALTSTPAAPASATNTTAASTNASTTATADPFGTGAGAGAMPNPWTSMMGGGMGGGGMGGLGGMGGGMPGMDPNMMNQMMQDPTFAQYMSNMLQNPQVLESMIAMNPTLAAMGPEVQQMLQSPQFQQMISNPEMLRQVAQMSQQMGGMGGMGGMGAFGGAPGNMYNPWASPAPASTTTPTATTQSSNPTSATATTTPTSGAAPASNPFAALGGAPGTGVNPMAQYWAQQMAAMGGAGFGGTAAPAQSQEPPEVRFQVQLQQLNEMGFYDAARNIRALLAAGGNVNGAIEMLFSGSI
ncbi:hypothetical protein BC939DRAFT_454369 [Gamsiella multidivaricata]|uniref:uncharacterized protein n=1 Tax=Gamsiella multidivaricata TaxID=101098 RepID=UPI002220A39C|nr:uncharacterized protein BC939DRAFT_454369 [Gamsiella multidivaricata]KAI7821967.1 hypothetical protein BC939DRAFT_454369 [Gamsiella multidivaricata]